MEVDQELQRGLIGIGVQTLKHLYPMRVERVGTPAGARFCVPVSALADHHTARAGIVTPESDTTDKGAQLATVKATRVLGAQFIEELGCVDVRPCVKPAAHQRPDQCKRMTPLDVTSRKLLSLKFAPLFGLWIQRRRG